MNYSISVDLLHREDQLRQVYPSVIFAQSAICLLVHDFTHVTARAVIGHHVQIVESLESIVELRHKLMVNLALDLLFSDYEAC